MNIVNFTPYPALTGGIMIGLAAAMMLGLTGRIAGVSGILNGAMDKRGAERQWRALFVIGLPLGALVAALSSPEVFEFENRIPGWALVAGGLLVGYGTRMGSGCTSGHGVCGISRFSKRSLVATLVFIACGMLSVFAMRMIGVHF